MDEPTQVLRRELADLLRRTDASGIEFVLVGGFGVLLRIEHAARSESSTLAPIPVARSTVDLDLTLSADVIADATATRELRTILDELGYEPIPGAEYYQFMKEAKLPRGKMAVKIDLFGEEPPRDADVSRDDRRIRPHGFRELHAHRAEEAVAITERPIAVRLVEGVSIPTPNLFSYSILKLFALRDRHERGQSEHVRQHAYDLYALWASADENIWTGAIQVSAAHADHPRAVETGKIVGDLFSELEAPGTLLLRRALADHGVEENLERLAAFLRDLRELFPGQGS